jgi:hypothetical protein
MHGYNKHQSSEIKVPSQPHQLLFTYILIYYKILLGKAQILNTPPFVPYSHRATSKKKLFQKKKKKKKKFFISNGDAHV